MEGEIEGRELAPPVPENSRRRTGLRKNQLASFS